MTNGTGKGAPALLRRLIGSCLPPEDRGHLLHELDELFADRVRRGGRRPAVAWYTRQAGGFALRWWSLRVGAWASPDLLRDDVRDAARTFRRRPVYATAFVVTLAVATGLLATVYTAARWVLLRPVPGVANPGQLVTLRLGSSEAPSFVSWEVSHPDYLTLRDRLPLGGELAARTAVEVDLRAPGGEPVRVSGELVTANYFSVAGVDLVAGRTFLPEEDDAAGTPVVILSHALARQLALDAGAATGMDVTVNGRTVRVVGVTSPGFHGVELPGAASIWLPLAARAVVDPAATPGASDSRAEGTWRRMIGRLPDGTSVAQVSASAATVVAAVRSEFGSHSYQANHQRLEVFAGVGLDPSVREEVKETLQQLAIAGALLLLLAMANLGNLTLIESTRKATDVAVRLAIGASRSAIVRRSLVESSLLGLASSALAIGISVGASRWFSGSQLSEHGGSLQGIRPDLPLLGAALLVTWVVSAVVALRPALATPAPAGALGTRSGEGTTRGHRLRAGLVALQVALSVVLLVSAGLLGRTVANLRAVDLGFDPGRLMTFALDPHLHGYESARLARLAEELERDLAGTGGLTGSGFVSPVPLRSSYLTAALYGSTDPDARPYIGAGFYASPGLLPALGARVIAGEDPWRADSGTVVLSRSAAAGAFPGLGPAAVVGRQVPTRARGRGLVRVAAVIEDVQLSDVTREAPGVVFRPLAERYPGLTMTGLVASREPAALAGEIRRVVAARAPDLPVFELRTARSLVDLQFADRRAMARAAIAMSAVGLLLAAIGLYAALSAMVAARRREFGVRAALGEGPHALARRVIATGIVPVLAGIAVGSLLAVGAGRLLASRLFGLAPLDTPTFAATLAALLGLSLVTAVVPAVRAMRVSPIEVLRE